MIFSRKRLAEYRLSNADIVDIKGKYL